MSQEERIKTITIRYSTQLGDVDFKIAAIDRKLLTRLGKKHRKPITNSKTHQTEYELNEETYYPDLYGRIVKGWSGLTVDIKKLLCHEVINGQPDNTEVAFNLEDLVDMARTSIPFAQFIEGIAIDFDSVYAQQVLANRKRLEEEQLEEEFPN